jgi:hypothetical protein
MAVEDEIRQASEQFYAALNHTLSGDHGLTLEYLHLVLSLRRSADPFARS